MSIYIKNINVRNILSFHRMQEKGMIWVTQHWNSLPERLWSLLLWQYPKCAWMPSCAMWSRWACKAGSWTGWFQTSLPTLSFLWFCEMFSIFMSSECKQSVRDMKQAWLSENEKKIQIFLYVSPWKFAES